MSLFQRIKSSYLLWLFLAGLLAIPALLPLFSQGMFVSDDGGWMIVRSSAFHEAFRDGQVPTRFLGRLNQEYGYPVAHFLYPLYLYLAEPIHLIGFDFTTTIKILFGLSLLSSCLFSYMWLQSMFSRFAALVGASVSLYLPYHLFTTYSRGSIGEVLALGILPVVLYALETRRKILASFGVGMLLLSHNILSLVFLPFLFLYMTLRAYDTEDESSNVRRFRGVFELGIGLSAFFWIPALLDLRHTIFSQTKIANWQEYFADLPLIGLVSVFLLGLGLLVFVAKPIGNLLAREVRKHHAVVLLFMILVGLAVLFMTTPVSTSLWEILPSAAIQFPYRLLAFFIPVCGFIAAFLIHYFRREIGAVLVAILVILFSFSYSEYIPKKYDTHPDTYYSTNMDTTTTHREYMPSWVKEIPSHRPETTITSTSGFVGEEKITNKTISFTSSGTDKRMVDIHKLYFPGWVAKIANEEVMIKKGQYGQMQLELLPGTYHVVLSFVETPVRLVADGISLVSFFVLIWLGLRQFRKGVL